jgi:hypothetical protein
MNRFLAILRTPRAWITIGLVTLLAGSLAFVGWAVYDSRKGSEAPPAETVAEETVPDLEPPPPPPPPEYFCPLDGSEYEDRALTLKKPVVVQVDNAPAARPQSGLGLADIVYEEMAEGQITRFTAVYGCRDAETVGPVRSARLIDLELVPEYQGLLANSGSSIGVTNAIAGAPDVPNINHGAYPSAYWRVGDRYAPHNLMTNTATVRQAAAAAGYPDQVELEGYSFKSDAPAAAPLSSISIPYSPWADTSYSYDAASNSWMRLQNGQPHIDTLTGAQLSAKNVIIQYVNSYESDIKEDQSNYGLIFDLTGSGKALVFQDGKVISGTWSRPTESSITSYIDDSGTAIRLDRGTTWVQLVPTGFPSVSWQ